MSPPAVLFWLAAALVLYTYAAYPLLLGALARRRAVRPAPGPRPAGAVAVVLAAHNEEPAIGRRVRELAGQVAAAGPGGAVIVVSDGSTDRTASAARAAAATAPAPVRVLELPARQGKAAALNAGCAAAGAWGAAFVAFADARQHWDGDALERLLENFADPTVGAVSGDLVVAAPPGVLAGVGLYWRFEKWLRQAESRAGSLAGVTGSICAVRQALFRPMPPGTILDDVDWPLQVACQGYRLVHDGRAVAWDRLPPRARDEFRRKLRTLCGNFQLLARRPALLVPWRNPVWWQLVSHRVLRLAVPWALLVALGSSALLDAPAYRAAFGVQVALYLLGLAGFWPGAAARCRPAAAAASFLVLNAAAWLAFWVWATGGAARAWVPVAYDAPRPAPARPPWSPAP